MTIIQIERRERDKAISEIPEIRSEGRGFKGIRMVDR